MNSSILLTIRDEIALEGLAGITFEALFVRLEERLKFLSLQNAQEKPLFDAKQLKEKKFQNFIFKTVLNDAQKENVQFYLIDADRPKLVIYNRSEKFLEDTGTLIYEEDMVPDDIYEPIVCVKKNDVCGSCLDFQTREDITHEVLFKKIEHYEQFKSKYNLERVVLVASQKMRAIALFGLLNWKIYSEMKIEMYVILEAIARKRWYGLLNSGKEALKFQNYKLKSAFWYYKKLLLKDGHIIQYMTYMFHPSRKQCTNSLTIYLPRLRPPSVNPVEWKAFELAKVFSERKVNTLLMSEVKNFDFFTNNSKRIRDFLLRFPSVFDIKKNDNDNQVVEYLRPLGRPLTTNDLYESVNIDNEVESKESDEDDDDVDDDDEDFDGFIDESIDVVRDGAEEDQEEEFRLKACQLNRYYIERICKIIDSCGPEGITRVQLLKKCRIPNHFIRGVLRVLCECYDFSNDVRQNGRQKYYIYRTKRHAISENQQSSTTQLMNQRTQLRKDWILEYIREKKVIDTPQQIRKYISKKETDISFQVDLKSILRILNELYRSKDVLLYHYRLSCQSFYRTCMFVFSKDAAVGNEAILEHLLLKNKFTLFSQYPINIETEVVVQSLLSADGSLKLHDLNESFSASSAGGASSIETNLEVYPVFEPSVARKYGCLKSKIERVFELYRYLFCLLVDTPQYEDINDWRHHIPKLNKILSNRTCFLVEFLLYMPISTLRNITMLRFIIPGLQELLHDPQAKYQKLYQVDFDLRRNLMHSRKAILDIYDLLVILSHFKLIKMFNTKETTKAEFVQIQINTELNYNFDDNYVDDNVKSYYNFSSIDDFDKFVDDVYNHLFHFADQCPNCPFDPSINIHSIPLIGLKCSSQITKMNKSLHQLKRKQNLKNLPKKKRIRLNSTKKPIKNDKIVCLDRKISSNKKKALRPKWNRDEDNFLLKCRIASLLLDPTNRYQLCIPTSVASSWMASYIGTTNKDSLTCARRLLYFHRKPYIQRIIKFCLLELIQENILDSVQTEDVNSNKKNQSSPLIPIFKTILDKILDYQFHNTEFFISPSKLRLNNENGSSKHIAEKSIRFMDLDSLLEKYEIVNLYDEGKKRYYLEPKNYYDIHGYCITNILISSLLSLKLNQECDALASIKVKRFYMRSIFKALKHFPDTLTKFVTKRLVQFDILSYTKSNSKAKNFAYQITKNFLDKITCMNFMYNLKFTSNCTEADSYGNCFANLSVEDNNSLSGAIHFAECLNSEVLGFTNQMPKPSLDNIKFHSTNELYSPSSLYAVKFNCDIPNNFIKIPNENFLSLGHQRGLSRRRLLSRNLNMKDDGDNVEAIYNYTSTNLSNDDMLVNHCKVQTIQCFNASLSILTQKLVEKFRVQLQVFDPKEFASTLSKESQLKLIEQSIEVLNQRNDVQIFNSSIIQKLIEFIYSQAELGANIRHLIDLVHVSEDDLLEILYECEKFNLVFGVGILERTWVHRDYIRYWMVASHENLDESIDINCDIKLQKQPNKIKAICFLPKIWKLPDGRLDCNILFAYLNHLIGYLMIARTTVDQTSLIEHYHTLIAPVQLLELIDILISIECIRKTVQISQFSTFKPSLQTFDDFFSSQSELPTSQESTMNSSDSELEYTYVYEATIDAYSRLFSLYHAMKHSDMENRVSNWKICTN